MILLVISTANAIYLFTRNKPYHFFHKSELSNTPNAEFIDRDDLNPASHVEFPSLGSRAFNQSLHIIRIFWYVPVYNRHMRISNMGIYRNFLLGREQPVTSPPSQTRRVQRLNVWSPNPGEIDLFMSVMTRLCDKMALIDGKNRIYSPLHSLLWQAVSPGNWISICTLMATASFQVNLSLS